MKCILLNAVQHHPGWCVFVGIGLFIAVGSSLAPNWKEGGGLYGLIYRSWRSLLPVASAVEKRVLPGPLADATATLVQQQTETTQVSVQPGGTK